VVTSNIIQSVCLVGKGRLKESCGLEPRTNFLFRLRNRQKLVRIRFGCGLDSRIYGNIFYVPQPMRCTNQSDVRCVISAVSFCLSGAFAKLRKATISFCVSVSPPVHLSTRLSVRMEQLHFHWTDFYEILCDYFLKIYRENSILIKI
jgi:hypothetical protein